MTEKTCGLCGHALVRQRGGSFGMCGEAAVYGEHDVTYLCHADDHDCYSLWTIYGRRPKKPRLSH